VIASVVIELRLFQLNRPRRRKSGSWEKLTGGWVEALRLPAADKRDRPICLVDQSF